MPKTIETTVYTLAELEALGNDKATERAYEWLYDAALDHEWWESTYDDAKQIGAEIRAFDLDRGRSIELRLTRDAISVALAIVANHGSTCETYILAQDFIGKHDAYHGVNGKITLAEDASNLEAEWEGIEAEFTRALGEEYLSLLRREYDFLSSREQLADFAAANEYTFTAEGKRFG